MIFKKQPKIIKGGDFQNKILCLNKCFFFCEIIFHQNGSASFLILQAPCFMKYCIC